MRGVRPTRGTVSLRPFPGVALATALLLQAVSARPQTDDELAAARKVFSQALADEEAGRYDTALEEFQRVDAVKDTANVRYHIAKCLEALGRRAEALSNYDAAVRLALGDKTATDAARESAARIGQLEHVIPRLTVVVPPDAPPDTEVRVDDLPVSADALRNPMPLDPGRHTIAANALGKAPYRTGVTLAEGSNVTITVALQPLVAPSADGGAPGDAGDGGPVPPAGTSGGASPLAIGLLGLGGALAIGSVVSFVLRASSIDTLNKNCSPVGSGSNDVTCKYGTDSESTSARSAAITEQNLGWGLAAGAAAAIGAGLWLSVTSHPASAPGGVAVSPVVSPTGGMLVVSGPLPR
jgi:hypothetical protein